ncbi:family 16 glycoside hydrolase [Trichoderma novae-zelandiae]
MHASHSLALCLGALLACKAAHAQDTQYILDVVYDETNFFSSFDFFSEADPTHGFVQYVDAQTANAQGLAGISSGGIFMGTDSTTQNPAGGRQSVRLTSQQQFNHGLFIADIAHMPGSICGVWPAFWMFGPDWPNSGEIDIIEGCNTGTTNQVTLHTAPGFNIANEGSDSSTQLLGSDCGPSNTNSGCGQRTADNQNYGDGFNAIGGGVYATEWTSEHIAVWFFPRTNIPADVDSGAPNPDGWGAPLAKFSGGNVDGFFKNNNIVFNTALCGDWAGNIWASDPECSALAPTCEEYVANNPSAFVDAFWIVKSVSVYH